MALPYFQGKVLSIADYESKERSSSIIWVRTRHCSAQVGLEDVLRRVSYRVAVALCHRLMFLIEKIMFGEYL